MAPVVAPSLLNTKPLCVQVELGGRHTAGATLVRTAAGGESPNTQVALGVDAEAFEEFFLTRIEGTEASVNSRG